MKILSGKEQEYQDWYDKNEDPYSRRCFTYAEDWADLMEKEIEKSDESVEEVLKRCADKLSHDADTDGITGYMYGMAVAVLSNEWEHGEELRRWHNLDHQMRDEGEKANEEGGVLNPAILNIKVKD